MENLDKNISENTEKKHTKEKILPVVMLRGFVMFPEIVLHFDVGRKSSILAIEECMKKNGEILLLSQKEPEDDTPSVNDIYTVGVISKVRQILKQTGEGVRILAEGVSRARVSEFIDTRKFLKAKAVEIETKEPEPDAFSMALVRKAREVFSEYLGLSGRVSSDLTDSMFAQTSLSRAADYILANVTIDFEQKQKFLEETNALTRLHKVIIAITEENEILKCEHDIANKIQENIDKSQKEYFLKEQIRAISQELGDEADPVNEAEEYKAKLAKLTLPDETREILEKECNTLAKTPGSSPEAHIQRTFLDLCFSLPWNKSTKDIIDIEKAQKLLDKNHYGLKDVKERILEFLAVRKLAPDAKGQIICLSGPPGVGKTSIARSLAKAMGKKFIRISLGGVNDESEIRGHRKTYVGALPGRILTSLRQVKSNNPLILLDEIDKLSKDYKGDPASALLEVLDPEQNSEFHDRYLGVPFDLSKVMFITTANDKNSIPGPLYDRLEIIDLYSYTHEEKFMIAKEHLVPKELKKHGLTKKNIVFSDESLKRIIEGYTKKAGVRELERKIATVMRKTAKKIVSGELKNIKIDEQNLKDILGPEKYKKEKLHDENQIGVVNGLAWTSVGGESLPIEVALMKGRGKVQVTGSLGDVMKESAQIAVSYIRSNCKRLGIRQNFYKDLDIHIHAPEGAVPKDGPSAGVTMTTALVSALSKNPAYKNVAMTGEVTLKGKVLPIGGLKEKAMAAYKEGVKTVIIPADNESDLDKIDDIVKKSINFVMADNLDTVFEHALVNKPKRERTGN